jgi:asparagine synthase (glutamine-hydrolysing)
MCGIAGYHHPEGIRAGVLAAMSSSMRHRGPDDEGYLCLDANGKAAAFSGPESVNGLGLPLLPDGLSPSRVLGLAHRRLSILDLSTLGHQPMQDEHGNAILLNGEIYNYREIREELIGLGHRFRSETDTEVVLAAWQQWNTACFSRFRGMWAMAIWDARLKEIILSRDRFAIKPLYIVTGAVFAFASEAKALLEIPGIYPHLNQEALFQSLSYGGIADLNATLFDQIRAFPPGHWMKWRLDGRPIHIEAYYNLRERVEANPLRRDEGEVWEAYSRLFTDAVRLHLRSDVPVGSCLSGGLDSSAVVAEMARLNPFGEIHTFTAAYTDPAIDESAFATRVADHFPNVRNLKTYPAASALWEEFHKLIWHQDFPIHSTSMFAQWEVMKLAGQNGMKVLLDGQGADEVLGGYDNFLGALLWQKLSRFQWLAFLREAWGLKENRLLNVPASVSRAAFHHLPETLRKQIRKQMRPGQHFLSKEFIAAHSASRIPEMFARSPEEVRYISIFRGLRNLLHYEDRNAMAFSIESRVPFLDHKLVEYTLAVPVDKLNTGGYSKYILRKSAESFLPPEVVWRKDKKGFITPQSEWQDSSLKAILEFLHGYDFPDCFDREAIFRMAGNNPGWGTPSNEFWKLLSILVWMDVFKIKPG